MFKTPRWPVLLLAPACLLVLLLCLAAWRMVGQERALERERLRERLETAASLVLRESERAYSLTLKDERASLKVAWDDRGLRRTGGVALAWSPAPPLSQEEPQSTYATGEQLEFGQAVPEQALIWYSWLSRSASEAVRAGALSRMARCERKLGRTGAALAAYEQLAALGATPVAGAPACLVGLRERAALMEASGNAAGARTERQRLLAALEEDSHFIDRPTFEFYAQGLPVSADRFLWAEVVEQLWRRAAEMPSASTILKVKEQRWIAEWRREGGKGTGILVRVDAMGGRLAVALEKSAILWQITDQAGARLAGNGPARVSLSRRPAETGVAWGIQAGVLPESGLSSTTVMAGGLMGLSAAFLGTLYLAYRAVRKELSVARMQSEFVAAVSHEFRSPITALTHLTDLLESGGTAQERQPLYFAALARETRRLREMVENLLDFGRIDAGRYKYRPESIELPEFLRQTLDEFRQQPAAAGRQITFDAGVGDARISADREALRRAIWNLLDNAAKYSPEGSAIAASASERHGWVRLSVADQGQGIAPEERKAIFQKFVRGRDAASGAVKGTGIGLAMVDAIVRAHGGRVELRSNPGSGSCFTLVLPQAGRD